MKLIFNRNDNGTDELKALIPYIDADLNYQNLKPDIKTATNDVVKLIGKEVYNIVEEIYFQEIDDEEVEDDEDDPVESFSEFEKNLLEAIRYPLAVHAYRLYAPTNDLSHTNNGRKMRSDDSEKAAFEWMIDRDNAAQEKRHYRALDDLIQFLDDARAYEAPAENPNQDRVLESRIRDAWTGSEAFKKSNSLFIRSVDDFDEVFPIKSRLLLLMLTPGIIDCEIHDINARITLEKSKELKEKLQNRQPLEEQMDLDLIKLIKRATAFSALAWSMPRFSVQLYPEGVLQHYTSDRATTKGAKPSLNIEVEAAAQAFRKDADRALLEIERLMVPQPTQQELNQINITPVIDYGDKYFSM